MFDSTFVPIRRALISVSDKTGLIDLARGLDALGVELLSTGGTAKALRDAGLEVRDVSAITGFPEIMDGRVKTLHPKIHGGLLGRAGIDDKVMAEHGIAPIDLLVVNLYPFEQATAAPDCTFDEAIENIDIGGPAMLRAAAKNHARVSVVVDPADYAELIEALRADQGTKLALRRKLATKVYTHIANYDATIANWLGAHGNAERNEQFPATLHLGFERREVLRYGENPHQNAALYVERRKLPGIVANARVLAGKELSYNNLVDLDAAWQLVLEFNAPAAAIIKHTNPCGCAERETLAEAYLKALEADPVSAFGGVLAFNQELDENTAQEVGKLFVEAIAAPAFSPGALAVLQSKKNLRLVLVDALVRAEAVVRSIGGGLLAQTPDRIPFDFSKVQVKTERAPTPEEQRALAFGWKIAKHVKSNAIVYARPGQTISVGAGQMSRVDSVKVGAMKAVLPLNGTVIASDAFFPFPDGIEEAAKHGITAVNQPGGSVRDEEVIAAANRLGLAMVFTGVRHFRH